MSACLHGTQEIRGSSSDPDKNFSLKFLPWTLSKYAHYRLSKVCFFTVHRSTYENPNNCQKYDEDDAIEKNSMPFIEKCNQYNPMNIL